MSLKLKFVEAASQAGANVSGLCREYGIARQTGHKWLRRYRELGYQGLVEVSRRPHLSPTTTPEEVVAEVVSLRTSHPSWGPHKISLVLARTLGADGPSKRTVARLLVRLGKIKHRRPPVRLWRAEDKPCIEVKAPNDLWTIDFKGWWLAANGQRCEPLTIRDAFSRFVFTVALGANTRGVTVRKVLQRLFVEHGVPAVILGDNGSPWCSSCSRHGLTRLSAWLVSLGICLVRSRPGSPQDNGGHERMHRDLSELQLSPASSRRAQQLLCDRWRLDFNCVRPHDALEGKTPHEVYRVAERRKPEIRLPVYPAGWVTRRVRGDGSIAIHGDRVALSRALAGHLVGLRHQSGLRWSTRFYNLDLGSVEVASADPLILEEGHTMVRAVNLNKGPEAASPVSS